MSPVVPSAGVFSVKITGRPRMLTGGTAEPGCCMFPSHTAEPPVPTDSAMVASCGNVSIEAIHTAFCSAVGSILAYIATIFSQVIDAAGCPDADTWTDAGQLTKPRGSPTPVPVMKPMSSYQASALGKTSSKKLVN